ncbi:MAG: hypothetical protein K1Y02_02800 [Candidatus Hydrogenedentes bacterium]|nr:hypothetical protein [Candidatus Hydrogenedentota bacterium]
MSKHGLLHLVFVCIFLLSIPEEKSEAQFEFFQSQCGLESVQLYRWFALPLDDCERISGKCNLSVLRCDEAGMPCGIACIDGQSVVETEKISFPGWDSVLGTVHFLTATTSKGELTLYFAANDGRTLIRSRREPNSTRWTTKNSLDVYEIQLFKSPANSGGGGPMITGVIPISPSHSDVSEFVTGTFARSYPYYWGFPTGHSLEGRRAFVIAGRDQSSGPGIVIDKFNAKISIGRQTYSRDDANTLHSAYLRTSVAPAMRFFEQVCYSSLVNGASSWNKPRVILKGESTDALPRYESGFSAASRFSALDVVCSGNLVYVAWGLKPSGVQYTFFESNAGLKDMPNLNYALQSEAQTSRDPGWLGYVEQLHLYAGKNGSSWLGWLQAGHLTVAKIDAAFNSPVSTLSKTDESILQWDARSDTSGGLHVIYASRKHAFGNTEPEIKYLYVDAR